MASCSLTLPDTRVRRTMIGPNYVVFGRDEPGQKDDGHVVYADIVIRGKKYRLINSWFITIAKEFSDTRVKPMDPYEACRFYTDMAVPIIQIGGKTTAGIACYLELLESGVFKFGKPKEREPIPFKPKEVRDAERDLRQDGKDGVRRIASISSSSRIGAIMPQARELVGV